MSVNDTKYSLLTQYWRTLLLLNQARGACWEYRHQDTKYVCGPMMGELDALTELRLLLSQLERIRESAKEAAPLSTSNELASKLAEQQERMSREASDTPSPQQQLARYARPSPNSLEGAALEAMPKRVEVEVTKPMRLTVENTVAGGVTEKIDIFIPNDFDTAKWGILQRAAVAKADAKNSWSKESLATIINAIIYAEKQNLSFEEGDIYLIGGKLQKTSQARIKQAIQSGLVESYTVNTELGEILKLQWRAGTASGTVEVPKLTTTVVVKLKAWKEPCSPYIATVEEWFDGSNPNWRVRPRYMLELNALGHALNRVATPSGVDSDEAPPL